MPTCTVELPATPDTAVPLPLQGRRRHPLPAIPQLLRARHGHLEAKPPSIAGRNQTTARRGRQKPQRGPARGLGVLGVLGVLGANWHVAKVCFCPRAPVMNV